MSEHIYLVEITPASAQAAAHTAVEMAVGKIPEDLQYDLDGDGRVTVRDAILIMRGLGTLPEITLRYCTGTGYTTSPSDTPANTFYEPRVTDPGLFRQSMFAVGTTGGVSKPGYGNIILTNADGGLDALVDYGFDGRECVVRRGDPTQPLSEFATLITGTIEQIEFSWGQIVLRLKDKSANFDTPVQTRKYAGTNTNGNGIEGGTELKDKPKPRLFGSCRNITPVLVNSSKMIYQVNDGLIHDIPAVHDGGNVGQILQGADYLTAALLEAAAGALVDGQAPTTYLTCKAEGLFMLNQKPFFAVTCEAIQGAAIANRTAGQIIKQLAGEKAGPEYIIAQSIIDLDKSAPYEIGLYINTDMTSAQAIDQICNSVGAWWGFDNLGFLWTKQLSAPVASQSLITLTQAEILDVERLATGDGDRGLPVYKVVVEYNRNWTVQNSGLAGSVTTDTITFGGNSAAALTAGRAADLATEYQRATATDAAVKTLHMNAPELTIKTLLTKQADAQALADLTLALRKVRRDRLRVTVATHSIRYPDGGIWDDEAIAEMPQTRSSHAYAIYNMHLFITGGYVTSFSTPSGSVIRLDINNPTGDWDSITVSSMPATRTDHSSVVYGDWLYVFGGSVNSTSSVSTIRLDLTTEASQGGAWDDAGVTNLPVNRLASTANVYLNYVYIVGGLVNYSSSASVIRLNLDTPAGAWDDAGVTDLPAARTDHASAVNGSYLYVSGGKITGVATASVIRLNLSSPTGAWDDAGITDLPEARSLHSMVVSNGYLYVLGGYIGGVVTKSVIRLNLSDPAGVWDDGSVADLPTARSMFAALPYNNILYAIGGYTTIPQSNTWRWRNNDNPTDLAHLASLGRTITIQHPRGGYVNGRPMKNIGTDSNYRDNKTILETWG